MPFPLQQNPHYGMPLLSIQKGPPLGFWLQARSAGILAQEPPPTHINRRDISSALILLFL